MGSSQPAAKLTAEKPKQVRAGSVSSQRPIQQTPQGRAASPRFGQKPVQLHADGAFFAELTELEKKLTKFTGATVANEQVKAFMNDQASLKIVCARTDPNLFSKHKRKPSESFEAD
jgi:hypothetical protein